MVADLLLTGGPLLLPDGSTRAGWAVAVAGGRISGLGPHDQVAEQAGSGTEVVDLVGRLLLPGFVDAHAHPLWGGLERLTCDLLEAPRTVAAYQAVVAATAAAHPDRPWITGGGWSFEAFPGGVATCAMLDAVVPDRPVVLFNRDHHGVWANTAALAVAGVDEHTPDPPDGRIERDAFGRPSGVLHEGAAALVTDLVPDPSADMLDAALRAARARLVTWGVTGWVEAILGRYAGQPDPLPTYLRAWRSGSLDVAATGALWWDRDRGLEQIGDLVARREAAAEVGVRLGQVKIMADGIVENQTAAMLTGYLRDGRVSPDVGISFVPREVLLAAVPALEQAGFAVHVHAIGDRAVRDALDAVAVAVAAARAARPGSARQVPHQIAHLQVVDPADVPRFGRLGVVANCQALWACHEPQMDDFTIPVLGSARASSQYPFAGIATAGGELALGSDWPVSTADPWQAVHVAVTRTPPEDPSLAPFLPEQALSLGAALRAGTAGSARAAGLTDCGRLEVGARADLVVASVDPFEVAPAELGEVRSDLVVVAGRVVAERGSLFEG
jgi:predicted amidohydrolase YtcJ